jgi:CRP/FNR family transcriptional regulator, dissimilatory nitrate respiration regulator
MIPPPKETFLADSIIFQDISQNSLQQLAGLAQEKKFRRGETIFLEGNISKGFYIVTQGQVKVFKMALDGREHILYILGPGEPFGLAPIFFGHSFPASAISFTETLTFFFPKQEVIHLISKHSDLALAFLSVQSSRMNCFTQKIGSLTLKGLPARLAEYLLEKQGRNGSVLLDIPKKQLAHLLGSSAEGLSRAFAALEKAGLIQMEGKTVHLVQQEELRKRCA